MNRQQIIQQYSNFLHEHKLKPEEFILGAGGACLMYGLRDSTDDMDMGLQLALFNRFAASKQYHTHYFGDTLVIEYNHYIDLHPITEVETRMVDGVCCYSPQTLLTQKLTLNRPKDQKDIIALKELIKKESNGSDTIKLYHYSKEKYLSLRTRKHLGGLTDDELLKAEEESKLRHSPGSYNEHISFFFDPVPLDIIGNLFKGKNDFWKNGNEIYEHVIDVSNLDKNIIFDVVETPSVIELLDNTQWVDTDAFLYDYLAKKTKLKESLGEVGVGLVGLEKQIKIYAGHTREFYIAASKRNDFDFNIDKYAASVPHLMLYPPSGEIKIMSTRKVTIGNSISTESITTATHNTILKMMDGICEEHPELTMYSGFGYCAYGSQLLKEALLQKNIKCELLIGEYLDDTTLGNAARKHAEGLVSTFPSGLRHPDGDKDIYVIIKKAFVNRGNKLPDRTGHAVVVIDNLVYDITSGQFGLEHVYDIDHFKGTWKKISVAEIVIDKDYDFYIKTVRRLSSYVDNNISLEAAPAPDKKPKDKKPRSPKAKVHKYKVTVSKDKEKTISLYKKSGYVIVKETEDKVFMEKKILSKEELELDSLSIGNVDYNDILEWQLIQAKEVQQNTKILSYEDVGPAYHIDKNTPKTFVPMMPRSAFSSENATTARVTISPNLIGCLIGYGRTNADFEEGYRYGKKDSYRGGYEICELPYQHCIKPTDKLIFEASRTDEHWLVSYNKTSLQYKPIAIGKMFVSEIVSKAGNGKMPSVLMTIYIYHDKAEGVKFSDTILLESGYHKAEVFFNDLMSRSYKNEKDFKVIRISKSEYDSAKDQSAALLSVDAPAFSKW